MSVKNLPILVKTLLIMSAFVVLTVASALFTTSQMTSIGESYAESISRGGQAVLFTARANRAAFAAYAAIGELVIASDDVANKEALNHLQQARADLVSFLATVTKFGGGYAEAAERIQKRSLQVIDTACANTVRFGQDSSGDLKTKAQTAFQTECRPEFTPLSKMIASETNALTTAQDKTTADLDQMTRTTVLTTFGVVIGGTVLLLTGAFFGITSWISRPVRTLTQAMERLAHGDNAVEVPDATRRDEVGAMARTVQVFKDAALAKLRLEAESEASMRRAEAERARSDEIKAVQAGNLAKVVEQLADGLGRIAEGDLTIRLDDDFAPEYERLRSDFNAAVQQMQGVLRSIIGSVGSIRSGTGEISQAAEDLSRRTEQQAASLEQTAAALEQITATVKRAAEGATQARAVVSRTRADAEQSGLVVQNAVSAMSEIEKSSHQISQIIGVIDEIAFQTNLLALNAGVEAARAGDAGRGFAVVASEVRALAQRSAEAAREIKTLISASTQQVGAGVKLVGDTGNALKRIVGQVGEVDGVVSEIAASSQEQATGLNEVNTAVTQMDQVTQQNAAMVEQSTAASRALANETESLVQLTSHFRLGVAADAPAPTRTSAPRPTTKARPPAPPRAPVRPVKQPGRRSNTLALVPTASADQDWQEF